MPKQIRLAINLLATGRHNASWKTLPDARESSTDIDTLVAIARKAEEGLLDGVFLADAPGGLTREAYERPWRAIDPAILVAVLAAHTRKIGYVVTTNVLYDHPAFLARRIASLHHTSRGRVSWNITTSEMPETLAIFGHEHPLGPGKYDKAEEFVQIVTELWRSLPEEAIVADADRGTFVDAAALSPIDYQGDYFRSAGVLGIPGTYHGERPVIVQAGASESSKLFGSKWADALFTSHWTKESSLEFYGDVKTYAAEKWKRDPAGLLIVPGLYPIMGSTEAEARQRKADLDDLLDLETPKAELAALLGVPAADVDLAKELPYDKIDLAANADHIGHVRRVKMVEDARRRSVTARQVLLEYLTGGHRIVVGTPEQVADDIVDWIDSDAADGFNFNVDRFTDGLDRIVEWLVPELQARGRFRTAYDGDTLRAHLGLDPLEASFQR